VSVYLSSSAVSGSFYDANNTSLLSGAQTIAAGTSTFTFQYRDTLAGTPTATVDD
jgi:hypothetical protein